MLSGGIESKEPVDVLVRVDVLELRLDVVEPEIKVGDTSAVEDVLGRVRESLKSPTKYLRMSSSPS